MRRIATDLRQYGFPLQSSYLNANAHEGCRKGNRECVFPDSTSIPSKQARTTVKSKSISVDGASSPSGDEGDEVKGQELAVTTDHNGLAIHDETEAKSVTTEHSLYDEVDFIDQSATLGLPEPATAPPFQLSKELAHQPIAQKDVYPHGYRSVRWITLPADTRLLLEYHKERLCHYHYAFRSDLNSFLKTTFLEIAVNDENEALLYAVLAFAAYHRTFAREDSGICNFLAYYNQSISLLQQSLKQPNTTTLLTILQLATIEEFLGDWVNLMGHQKALYQLITNIFTPQTIVENETQRQIIRWYMRFDVFVGTLSGGGPSLDPGWFEAYQEYHSRRARDRPQESEAKIEEYMATLRLLSAELTTLMATKSRNDWSHEQFERESRQLFERFKAVEYELASAYTTASNSTNDLSEIPSSSGEATVDSAFGLEGPKHLFLGEKFAMNFVLLDFWTAELMIRQQIAGQNTAELQTVAFKQCKMIDAIERSSEERKGALLACHSTIGLASLFLPRDQECIDWSRKKFAALEQLGYIYPAALRQRMSSNWGIDVRDSWLPDRGSHPAALRNVREFMDYRKTVPEAALDDQISQMNGILSTLWLDIRRLNSS